MKSKITLLLFFLFIGSIYSQNLLVNGGFETGSSGTGFVCNGAGYSQLTAPFSGTSVPGNFAVTNFPYTINTTNFIFEGDHTTGTGKMLVVDGNTNATNPRFWRAGNTGAGVNGLVIGTTYTFSYWIKSVSTLVTNPATQANISILLTGGSGLTLTSGSTIAPLPSQSWRHVIYTFTATATTATIELWNINVNAVGNDFAIDDMLLTDDLIVSYNVTNAACATATDGSLTVTGFGGTPPYVNYAISGPVNLSGPTGVFTNLPPGIYTVSVTDSAIPAVTATLTNANIGPALTTSINLPICIGDSTTLMVGGSTTGYTWTAVPPDPTLTTPNSVNPVVSPSVTTTYTATSTVGACSITKSVTVTVNILPIANMTGNATICPGNTAIINITGTPNSTVTITNTIGNTYVANIGPLGTGTFITPILNTVTTYNLINVKNFFTQCDRDYTGITVVIIVVPNGCATVGTAPGFGSLPLDTTLCAAGECRILEANISPIPSTTSYASSSIPYCPYPFIDPSFNVVPITGGDDFWSDVINLPFNFCFYGNNYTSCNAGTNGLLTFVPKAPGSFCPWPSTSVPISGQNQSQSIFGVYQDTDMAIPPAAADRQVNWVLQGTYPCRKLIVNFYNLGQWNSVGTNPGLQTSQIVLYEVSNIIEVFVQRRVAGAPWAGSGAIGLIGGSAAQWVAAPGRNTGNWSAFNEAWRFTPTGPNVPVTVNWYEGPTLIGTGPAITVCPPATTTYTVQGIYNVCSVPQTATSSVTLTVNPDITAAPNDITHCIGDDVFDLTVNTGAIIGALDPNDYEITYHITNADALALSNPILNPTTFTSSGQTIYAAIYVGAFGCIIVKPFDLILVACGVVPFTPPNITICDNLTPFNDGLGIFDLTPQTAEALGATFPPADYTVTYHLSLLDAQNDVFPINPINAFPNTINPQTIYIRMEENVNPTIYGTTSFLLIVNPIPTATISGNTTICSGNTAVITFNGTPNAVIDYTVDSTAAQITLDATGTNSLTTPILTSTSLYSLVGVTNPTTTCSFNPIGNVTINVDTTPVLTITNPSTVCSPNTVNITLPAVTAGSTGGGTLSYWTDAAATIPLANPTAITTSNTYYIQSTVGLCTDIEPVVVTITTTPALTITNPSTVCSPNTVNITLPAVTAGSTGGGALSYWTDAAATIPLANPTAITTSNTYYIQSTVGLCTDVEPVVVTITTTPVLTITNPSTVCSPNTVNITLPAVTAGSTGGGTLSYWTDAAATIPLANPTAITTSNTYYIQSTVGTCTDIEPVVVTITTTPVLTITNPSTVCSPNTINITLPAVTAGSTGGGTLSYWTDAAATIPLANPTAITTSNTYYIQSTVGLCTDVEPVVVTITTTPVLTITNPSTVCSPNTVNITLPAVTAGSTGGGTLSYWTNAAATIALANPTAITTSNTYYIQSTVGTCTDIEPVVVTITTTPVLTITNPSTVCSPNTVNITLPAVTAGSTGGGTLSYWTDAAATIPLANPTAIITSNTYYIQSTVGLCTDIEPVVVTITTTPALTITNPSTVCSPNTVNITLPAVTAGSTGGGTLSYWTDAAATIALANPTAIATSNTYYIQSTVGLCTDIEPVVVTINPLPTATISGTISVCVGATNPSITFTGSNGTAPYIFTYTINNGPVQTTLPTVVNSVSIAIPSTAVATTFTYDLESVTDSSSTTCSQNQAGSAVVTVIGAPVINTPTPYVVCDDTLNNDGIYCFDLTTKDNQITGGNSWTVTYHETLTDSQTGANPILSPSSYCNSISPVTQPIFVRVFDPLAPTCYSNTTLQLIVNPIPLANPVITDYELCDVNSPNDGQETFNLPSKTAEIANGQTGVTVTYYVSLLDAQNQTSPLPNLYPNTSNPQTIWINIRNNTTGCNSVSSFILKVNPLPIANVPPTIFQCSVGPVSFAQFNLTINEAAVTGGITGVTVTYYETLLAAQSGAPLIAPPTNYTGNDNQTIFIRVQNITTGCFAITTQLLRVTQGPLAVTPQPLQYCDPNNDGYGVFDLDSAINEIAGGSLPLGVTVSFYETATDALIGALPPLTSPYPNIYMDTQTIYVRVFYTLTGCANFVQLQLIVNPTPEATTPADYHLCDYTGAVGEEAFNLTSVVTEVLGSIDPSTHTVTFYESLPDAQTPSNAIVNVLGYPNTSNAQTIWIRVETIATGCFDIVELQLIVDPLPLSTQPNYPSISKCDYTGLVGYEAFDLSAQVATILLGQTGMDVTFYPSLTEATAGTNVITNPLSYTNTSIYVQTLGIRITNNLTGCYVISTMDIRVESLPTLTPLTEPYTLCDENQDGFTEFDFNTILADLLPGSNIVTFHETLADAQGNNNALPLLYTNINPFIQFVYVRAEDPVTGCYSVLTIELNVNPAPIDPININALLGCDQDSNPQDAQTGVNLTLQTAAILAQQPLPAINYTVTYYNSQTAADLGTAPIIPATNYVGTNGQTIWVRVEHTATKCFQTGSFQLEIDIPLLLTTPAPMSLCDDDTAVNNQFHEFNLTLMDTIITNNLGGYTVAYYPSLAEATAGINEIQNPGAYTNTSAAVQTLGVVVTSAQGCVSTTTLDIRVIPIPVPNTDPDLLELCDDNNPGDMIETFDLTLNEAYISNSDPNLTFTYFATQAEAIANTNPIADPTMYIMNGSSTSNQSVWIRVENTNVDFFGQNCFVVVEQTLQINPLPTVVLAPTLEPYYGCDADFDGIAIFDLSNIKLIENILGATQLPADYTVTFYDTAAGANPLTNLGETPLPTSYQNITPFSQDIYINIENNDTGCVNATGVLTLLTGNIATATAPADFVSCDDDLGANIANDGLYQSIDLTSYEAVILGTQDPTIYDVTYYESEALAIAGVPGTEITNETTYQNDISEQDVVWIRVTNTLTQNSNSNGTNACFDITTLKIFIERKPEPVIETVNGIHTICVNYNTGAVIRDLELVATNVVPGTYTYQWFEGGVALTGETNPTYTVETALASGATRTYTVEMTSTSLLACNDISATFDVIQSGPAVIPATTTGYVVTNAFNDNQTVTVTVEGFGTYQYSLDDGPIVDNQGIFTNVTLGTHTITVWDVENGLYYNCESLVIDNVQIIDYPHYFTPNGDGIHDTWNIVGLKSTDKIYIFDRYGKLLKQISPTGNGWDGTFNGHLLPSTDYWFLVEYFEQNATKEFRAHFSLKR